MHNGLARGKKAMGSGLTRRQFATATGMGIAAALGGPALVGRAAPRRAWNGDPFSLGVASGAPTADGFVLWTRLAPDPLASDPSMPGGMDGGDVTLGYEIATDPALRDIVRRGEARAGAAFAYSVHADIRGLQPGRPYWYRFVSGDAASRIGRATTLPAPGSAVERLRLGFVSCSHYEFGYFSAYRHLVDEHPDAVLFLGDYIYGYVESSRPTVRRHSDGIEAATLPTYRNRYAQYRLDPDLQRLHAEAPALVTWDDHEVQNDYADRWSQDFLDPRQFLRRRAAAYQAFYEHMPLRPILSQPDGPVMRIYDRFAFGDLLEVAMIDGRQYRSREACYGAPNKGGGNLESNVRCPERKAAGRSMLGFNQELWLSNMLSASRANWNVIAQDVLMAQLRQKLPDGDDGYWTDDWDGYPAGRARLMRQIQTSRVRNPVVVGGDFHASFANDLRLDYDDPASPVVAAEFVGTSVTSPNPPVEPIEAALPDNPHVHFFDGRHYGYGSLDIDSKTMTTRFQVVSDITDPKATVSTLRSFTVEDGRPGIAG
jgi:alkaline phosphatase D